MYAGSEAYESSPTPVHFGIKTVDCLAEEREPADLSRSTAHATGRLWERDGASGVARRIHRLGIRSRRDPDESFEMPSEVRLVRETGSVGDIS